jgi:hypothetical protein
MSAVEKTARARSDGGTPACGDARFADRCRAAASAYPAIVDFGPDIRVESREANSQCDVRPKPWPFEQLNTLREPV